MTMQGFQIVERDHGPDRRMECLRLAGGDLGKARQMWRWVQCGDMPPQPSAAAQLWDGWPSDASEAWIDAGKPAPRPVPRNPWPRVGLIAMLVSAAISGYALWRAAVAIW